MAKVHLRWFLKDEGYNVALEMVVDDEPKAHMILDAAELEDQIHFLSQAREAMAEPVTPDLEVGMRLRALGDPRWKTEPYHPHGAALLALRHPGMGWMSFLLPPHEARSLGQSLVAIADELEANSGKAGS